MAKLYLAHSIFDRARVRELELKLEADLGIELLNPFYDKPHATVARLDAGLQKPSDPSVDPSKIVDADIAAIDGCEGMLAVIGKDRQIGTDMEIFYNSHVLRRPTYLVIEDDAVYNHPWYRRHATERFKSLQEFAEYYKNKAANGTESTKRQKLRGAFS